MFRLFVKAIGALIIFTALVAVVTVVLKRLLGDKLPPSVLSGLIMGAVVVAAGTLGGWFSNELKRAKQAKSSAENCTNTNNP